MYGVSNNSLIGLTWVAHFFFLFILAISFARAAIIKTGHPFVWPVSLRWILASLFFLMSFMAVDVVRIRLLGGASGLSVVFIRLLPIPFEIWATYRMFTVGLKHDRSEGD